VNDFISLIEIGETQHNERQNDEMQINETKINESENVEIRGYESTEENTQEIVIHWNF